MIQRVAAIGKTLLALVCLFFVTWSSILAASDETISQIKALNALVARGVQEPSPNGSSALEQILRERRKIIAELIREDPGSVRSVILPSDVAGQIRRQTQDIADLIEDDSEWTGSLEIVVADDFRHQKSSTHRYLHLPNGQVELFGRVPTLRRVDVLGGSQVNIRGIRSDGLVAVDELKVLAAAPTPSTMGPQNYAVLLVTSPSNPNLPPSANFANLFFGDSGYTLNTYWRETSYGKTSAEGSVFGPFALAKDYSCLSGTGFGPSVQDVTAAMQGTVDLSRFNRIAILFAVQTYNCSNSGLATIGGNPSVMWIPIASGASDFADYVYALTHEGGHNLGLNHANSDDYGTVPLGPIGISGVNTEYGDPYSPMGGSFAPGHYSAQHKALILGWLTANDFQQVTGAGTYHVAPLETTSGVRGLRILRDANTQSYLWVEARQPLGVDASFGQFTGSNVFSGVLIHYEDPDLDHLHTYLLDFHPSAVPNNFLVSAMLPGESWIDPFSLLHLTVNSSGMTGSSVTVGFDPPCADLTVSGGVLTQAGGSGTIQVATGSNSSCVWTASTSDSWITLNSQGGQGNGTVGFTVAANTGTTGRRGFITVQRQSVAILQGPDIPTTTTLTASPNPSNLGQNVVLTAAVSPYVATGIVTFMDGSASLGTASVNGGTALLASRTLAVGTHSLTAIYQGDTNDASSTSVAVTQSVIPGIATTTSLTVSPMPLNYGQNVMLTATMSPSAATGTVTFMDGSIVLGTGDLSGGSANLALSTLSVGSHLLTAIYSGDARYSGASATVTETTSPSSISSPANIIALDNFQVPPYKTGALAGQTVGGSGFKGTWVHDLSQDLTVVAPGSVGRPSVTAGNAGDSATFSSPITLNAGQLFISYALTNQGASNLNSTRLDLNSNGSLYVGVGAVGAGANLNMWVSSGGLTTAQTNIPSTGSHRLVGVLDATNHQIAIFVDPTPQSFYNSTGSNNANAVAAWIPPARLTFISYSLVENLSDQVTFGDIVFSTDSTPLTQTITQAPTATELAVSPNPASYGQCVSLTGIVSPPGATGSITFNDGVTTIGASPLVNGVAGFTLATGPAGPHSYSASYSGDTNRASSRSAPVTEIVSAANATTNPVISCGGVVSSTGAFGGAASGTWITIYGSNLSSTARSWSTSDFNGSNLPTSLDGVKVSLDGAPGYVSYISPTQLNVLMPTDPAIGPVSVQVFNSSGTSNLVSAEKAMVAPSLFTYSQQGGRYAISQDGATYALLAPVGLLGDGVATRPPASGEIVILYGTGFGQTIPAYPDGQLIQSALPLPTMPEVSIGGVTATVLYAGLVGPGLYQLNIVVPQLPSGDAAISLNLNSVQSPSGIFLPIQ